MILPRKDNIGNKVIKPHSELTLRDVIDLLKIDKHGTIVINQCPSTGHKTIKFVPDKKYIVATTGIPNQRVNKLIRKGMVDNMGVRTTVHAWVHSWYFLGASPWISYE